MNGIAKNIIITVGCAFVVSGVATSAATIVASKTLAVKVAHLERRMDKAELDSVRIDETIVACQTLRTRVQICEQNLDVLHSDIYHPRFGELK